MRESDIENPKLGVESTESGDLFNWPAIFLRISPALRCLESSLSKSVFFFPSFLLHHSSSNIIKQRSAGIQRTLPLVFLHSVFFSLIWERIPDVREFSNSWMYSKWRVKLLSTRPTYYDPIDTICNKWVLSEKNFNFRFFWWTKIFIISKKKTFVWTMWTLLERKISSIFPQNFLSICFVFAKAE